MVNNNNYYYLYYEGACHDGRLLGKMLKSFVTIARLVRVDAKVQNLRLTNFG
jgi:hypothetical protein